MLLHVTLFARSEQKILLLVAFLFLVVRPGAPFVASLLLVAMPGGPSSFLLLVAMPGATGSFLLLLVRHLLLEAMHLLLVASSVLFHAVDMDRGMSTGTAHAAPSSHRRPFETRRLQPPKVQGLLLESLGRCVGCSTGEKM